MAYKNAAFLIENAAERVNDAIEKYNDAIADAWLQFESVARSEGADLQTEIEAWNRTRNDAEGISEDIDTDLPELDEAPEYSSNEPEAVEFEQGEIDHWLERARSHA